MFRPASCDKKEEDGDTQRGWHGEDNRRGSLSTRPKKGPGPGPGERERGGRRGHRSGEEKSDYSSY